MNTNTKRTTTTALIMLSALLLAFAIQNVNISTAQTNVANVIMLPTTGGTTNPLQGNYTYDSGTNIVLNAIPDPGYEFMYWIVSGYSPGHTAGGQVSTIIDPETGEIIGAVPRPTTSGIDSLVFTTNPANITCGYGYTYQYQAYFSPVGGPSPAPSQTDAVVIVMPTNGGTVTPVAGMYIYPNGTTIQISATPNAGYKFSYWLVSGNYTPGHGPVQYAIFVDPETGQVIGQFPRPTNAAADALTFTANPASITCGYGYTYTYTAIFEQTSSTASSTIAPTSTATTTATPTAQPTSSPTPVATSSPPTETGTDWTIWIIAIAVVVIIVVIVAVVAVVMRRKK